MICKSGLQKISTGPRTAVKAEYLHNMKSGDILLTYGFDVINATDACGPHNTSASPMNHTGHFQ